MGTSASTSAAGRLTNSLLRSSEQHRTIPRDERFDARHAFELAASALLAGILLYSGISHLMNHYYFLSSVYKYELVGPVTGQIVAAIVPTLQIAIATCLAGRIWVPGALLASSLLFTLFAAAQVSVLWRGLTISCGCFSASASQMVSMWTVSMVVALALVSILALITVSRDPRQGRNHDASIQQNQRPRSAFSLVELLVVLAVIGSLLALTVPAVQHARESARATQCENQVKQQALGMLQHQAAMGHFPTNGWGFLWMGDPDRDTGRNQPGGWIYNILSFIEHDNLRQLGRGENFFDQRTAIASLQQTPVRLFVCPSRSRVGIWPQNRALRYKNADAMPLVAKTDYAVNEGDFISDTPGGPDSYRQVESGAYDWTDVSKVTGISFLRSETRPADITDGMSSTYLLGEKYVSRINYGTAEDPGHDQSMFAGVDLDITRWTIAPPQQDTAGISTRTFGSTHPGGCRFALADGSVHTISYDIDQAVHQRLGNRRDGRVAKVPQ